MKAIEIVCSSFEWWGDRWGSAMPYSFDACTIPDGHQLPNAPVNVEDTRHRTCRHLT